MYRDYIIKKQALYKIGGFDEKIKYGEDFDLVVRLVFSGFRLANLKDELYEYRIHPIQMSNEKNKQQKDLETRKIIYDKVLNNNFNVGNL